MKTKPLILLVLTLAFYMDSMGQKTPCGTEHIKAQPKVFLNCRDKILFDEELNQYYLAKDGRTLFDGTCQTYNQGGFVIEELTCKNGKRDGQDHSYYGSGCVRSIQTYSFGVKNGPQQVFFDSTGQIQREENYLNGKLNGRVIQLTRYGDTVCFLNYAMDLPDGIQREYYPDGTVKKQTQYDKGLITGLHINYNEKGKVISTLNYKLGKNDGKWTYFSDEGKILGIQNWLLNQKNGDFITYDDKGTTLSKGTFKKDIPVGEHLINNEKGKTIHQTIYDKKGVKQYEMEVDEYGDIKVLFDIKKNQQETKIEADDNPENIQNAPNKKNQKKRKKERRKKEKS